MIRAAAQLFRERGYAATSFQDVIARSGAPRGSIYHHFPRGKEQLAEEALRLGGDRIARAMATALAERGVPDAVVSFFDWMADRLRASDFRAGCEVAGVALDTSPAEPALVAAASAAFARWREVLAEACVRAGATEAKAQRLAVFVISAMEGALILARVQHSTQPVSEVAAEVRAHLAAALADPA